jgi:hypothetical protein
MSDAICVRQDIANGIKKLAAGAGGTFLAAFQVELAW